MSVCDRFTIEIYGFMHSLSTFLACAAYNTIMMKVEDREDRRRRQAREQVLKYKKTVNCSTKMTR